MSVRVSLGNVIRHRSEFIEIDDFEVYKRCRVQVNTKGIILRDKVKGIEIKTKRQQVCKAGEFLVAEIDAKMGGFGIVPPELDGAIVSSHYFLYEVDESVLDAKYLGFYIRTSDFIDQVQAQGSTNYAAIRPHDVLEYTIPLPPLEEQRRIVARIEALATKIEEAQKLRQETNEDFEKLLSSAYREISEGAEVRLMGEIAPLVRRPVEVNPFGNYSELGVRSFGKGTFHKPTLTGADIGDKRIFEIQEGDLVFQIVFAWEGAVAVARPEDHGRVGSHRFLTCVPKEGIAKASYLCLHFLSPQGLEQLGTASPGGAGRNRTLGLKALADIPVSVPTYEKQLWLNDLVKKVELIKKTREESSKEEEILLPIILNKAFKSEL